MIVFDIIYFICPYTHQLPTVSFIEDELIGLMICYIHTAPAAAAIVASPRLPASRPLQKALPCLQQNGKITFTKCHCHEYLREYSWHSYLY